MRKALVRIGELTLLLSFLVALVALMAIPQFNPGSVEGSFFGMAVMAVWGCALFIWALGGIRSGRFRLRGRTALLAISLLAVMFGAFPWLLVPYSIQLGFAGISAAMIHEARLDHREEGGSPKALRGRSCLVLLFSAGLLGVALVIHGIVANPSVIQMFQLGTNALL